MRPALYKVYYLAVAYYLFDCSPSQPCSSLESKSHDRNSSERVFTVTGTSFPLVVEAFRIVLREGKIGDVKLNYTTTGFIQSNLSEAGRVLMLIPQFVAIFGDTSSGRTWGRGSGTWRHPQHSLQCRRYRTDQQLGCQS